MKIAKQLRSGGDINQCAIWTMSGTLARLRSLPPWTTDARPARADCAADLPPGPAGVVRQVLGVVTRDGDIG